MPLLFSYGTLTDPAVQLELFGRTLSGADARLLDYERHVARVGDEAFARKSGSVEHAILRPARGDNAFVDGTVLEMTEDELACADRYEPAQYARVEARLACGATCWVYVEAKPGVV